ncbi:MAG: hypothetical protein HeimC3_35820 [Candidatus Heimdallarchaeota archaeon LC_3]|nr:MAG: hypothetical protein HeimC3_35820 [Candidatus Heimdallarchaeota archaeon LC_3]
MLTPREKWNLLCKLLLNFGTRVEYNILYLNWSVKDEEQFIFLTRCISQCINVKITGFYDYHKRHWKIQLG